jgi:hypothetical protein
LRDRLALRLRTGRWNGRFGVQVMAGRVVHAECAMLT